jgi:O-antigen/teichoic acid export membrane protein
MTRRTLTTQLLGLRRLINRPYHDSVIRRAAILLMLVVPAFAANMMVSYGAAALLAPDQFGIFYVANTISNVLFSGSLVLNMVFTRYLVAIALQQEQRAVSFGLGRLERVVIGWGALGAAAGFVTLWAIGRRVGMQSNLILLLVILDVYTAYVADLGRILLQSLRRTVALGLYTLVWMLLRLVLCMLGVLAFHTVWGGFLGIVASAMLVSSALHIWAARQRREERMEVPPVPSLWAISPVLIAYGLTIAVSNLDVLLSYFLLDGADLGTYSASSVFPKAIIVVIMPLLQMLFPIAIGTHLSGQQSHMILAKSGVVIIAVTLCGTIATWMLSGLLCGGTWGIKHCEAQTLDVLLWSVAPLVLLRAVVLLQFARGADWLAASLAVPMIGYLYVAWQVHPDYPALARTFTIFSFAALVFLGIVHAGADFIGARRAAA